MGAIMASYWIQYHMRLFEPYLFGTPDMIEQCLSLMEKNGGEDESFRQYVTDFVKSNTFDNFHIPDERIGNFLSKNLDARTSIREIMKEWNEFIWQLPLSKNNNLNEKWILQLFQDFEEYRKNNHVHA